MLHLFDAFGIELEYMIVNAATLDVRPIADRLLEAQTGEITGDAEFPDGIGWSNELVSHVIELKTANPWPDLATLPRLFHEHVGRVHALLRPMGACLLPGAMHPWMDPFRETVLWPHESSEIYQAFNRIFDCRGHGWSNLQSMHINLPFAGDEEFARLHAAVRLVLPILPALAASSPIMDGRATGTLDNRLAVYRTNCAKLPSVTGRVVPEPVFSEADYHRTIFDRIRADVTPHDPEGVLRDEFTNARGAIARFGRGSIEIRVIDLQECPAMDLAIARLVVATLRALVEERWAPLAEQQAFGVEPLAAVFEACVRDADRAPVDDARYVRVFGVETKVDAGTLWRRVADAVTPGDVAVNALLDRGPLARRILMAAGGSPSRERLHGVYRRLAECLDRNEPFSP